MTPPAGTGPRRRALLLACARFQDPDLPDLRSPARDAEALGAVLHDTQIGGYEVEAHVDCTTAEARQAIEGFFAGARPADTHLLYFSCHGLQDRHRELHFAFADTRRDLLHSTALSAEWVRTVLGNSRATTTIVLVDCCFSGAFLRGLRTRAATGPEANVNTLVRDLPEGNGVAVLTASRDTEFSFESDDLAGAAVRPSYFTEAVVTGLATGAADRNADGHVTVDELYKFVYDRVTEGPSEQRPRMLGAVEGDVVVARAPRRGAAPPVPQAPPPTERVPTPAVPAPPLAPWPPLPVRATATGRVYVGAARPASGPPTAPPRSTHPVAPPRPAPRRRRGRGVALTAAMLAILAGCALGAVYGAREAARAVGGWFSGLGPDGGDPLTSRPPLATGPGQPGNSPAPAVDRLVRPVTARLGNLQVTVTRVAVTPDRSDVTMKVRNGASDSVSLPLFGNASLTEPGGRTLPPQTLDERWPGTFPGGGVEQEGTVYFTGAVGPAVTSVTVTFATVFGFGAGNGSLVIRDIPLRATG